MVRITWGLRDGRSITVRSTEATAKQVTDLAEGIGALWIQHPPGSDGDLRLWLKDGPVQTIHIERSGIDEQ